MTRSLPVVSIASLFVTAGAFAQANQTYRCPWGAVTSRVQRCLTTSVPPISGQIAMDDWIAPVGGGTVRLDRVRWWGTLPNGTAAAPSRFYIRILGHDPTACRPGTVTLASWCVMPQRCAGSNCVCPLTSSGGPRRYYRFTACLNPAFVQQPGQHYWIQISEDDSMSGTQNADDFKWLTWHPTGYESGAAPPVANCPAVRFNPAFGQPIFDDCPGASRPPADLAFRLYTESTINPCNVSPTSPCTVVVGQLPLAPNLRPPFAFTMEVNQPNGGALVARACIDVDAEGRFEADLGTLDGMYDFSIRGMAAERMLLPAVHVEAGMAEDLDFPGPMRLGDLNNDGHVDGDDIGLMLQGLMGP